MDSGGNFVPCSFATASHSGERNDFIVIAYLSKRSLLNQNAEAPEPILDVNCRLRVGRWQKKRGGKRNLSGQTNGLRLGGPAGRTSTPTFYLSSLGCFATIWVMNEPKNNREGNEEKGRASIITSN